ncbi:MAG: Crp/Fnr family transcriptional regulator [Candidatus Binatia bacterium]
MSVATFYSHPATQRSKSEPPAALFGRTPALQRKVDALRNVEALEGIADSDFLDLAKAASLKHFPRGRVVCHPSSHGHFSILMNGRVKTSTQRSVSGAELGVGLFRTGDVIACEFGGDRETRTRFRSLALVPSDVLFVPQPSLTALLLRNPPVAIRFLRMLSDELARVVELTSQLSCLDVRDRLYLKLNELSALYGRTVDCGVRIEHGLHQSDLAASIGASREAVNRQLASWRAEGLVAYGTKFLLVRNPAGLRMAASDAVRKSEAANFEACALRNR